MIYLFKRVNALFFILLPLAQFGCIPMPAGGASDVPCLEPTAWTGEFSSFLLRREGGSFLLTAQTIDQYADDFNEDGVIGNGEHGAVYRFDTLTGEFSLVDESTWEASQGEVRDCGGTDGSLLFGSFVVDGQEIPVRGRAVQGSSFGNVVAILSTNGNVPIPLITGASTGQHYSQFFSADDFSPLSEPVQVGVGETVISACWTVDGRFLIYHQKTLSTEGETGFDVLCFVENTTEVTIEAEEESP